VIPSLKKLQSKKDFRETLLWNRFVEEYTVYNLYLSLSAESYLQYINISFYSNRILKDIYHQMIHTLSYSIASVHK